MLKAKMNDFEQLVQESYRALLDISPNVGDREQFFPLMFRLLPETVVDKETLQQIEINELFRAMDHTKTLAGAATLYRSLIQPLSSLDLILAKQESLQELESNDRLRDAVFEYLMEIKKSGKRISWVDGDHALDLFLNGGINEFNPYPDFKAAMKTGTNLADAAVKIPKPESMYLEIIVSALQNFSSTESYRLMRGPVYRTFRGLRSKEDINFLTPRWKFIPQYIIIPPVILPISVLSAAFDPFGIGISSRLAALLATVGGCSLLYMPMFKPKIDYKTAIVPLESRIGTDPEFQLAFDSLGRLDELASFYEYARVMPGNMKIPRIVVAENHHFMASNLRNPILGKYNQSYVPSDVELDNCKLTFLTGPNSGGKTTLGKTIAQTQIMAQIGCYVSADDAEISVADRISYQYYMPDRLGHPEGDFGVNLARTRDIFYAATPKSLVILNVLASGTTSHEELEQAYGILRDFSRIGNNTIYVTHRYELAERFKREGLGQFLRTDFADGKPTFIFVPGISTESHAADIAKRIGFSPQDRNTHLADGGYLK